MNYPTKMFWFIMQFSGTDIIPDRQKCLNILQSENVLYHLTYFTWSLKTSLCFAAVLFKDGHSVEFEEIDDWNIVEIWVNGECVFKCDIRELDYGRVVKHTSLCMEHSDFKSANITSVNIMQLHIPACTRFCRK